MLRVITTRPPIVEVYGDADRVVTVFRTTHAQSQAFPHNRAYMNELSQALYERGYVSPIAPAHMTAMDFLCFLASCGSVLVELRGDAEKRPTIDTIIKECGL